MFSIKATVEGLTELLEKLRQRLRSSQEKDDGSVTVGFSAPWAIYVHEDVTKQHTTGQALFLMAAVRNSQLNWNSLIAARSRDGIGVRAAMGDAAVEIMKKAQQLAPEDTGVLRSTAYVKDDASNLLAGADITAAEALAWRSLLLKQRRQREKTSG